jgi:hypothetical protein
VSLADELRKLQELRESGTLTEDEFAQAKAALLKNPPVGQAPGPTYRDPRGTLDLYWEVVRTGVKYQMVVFVIALILGAIIFLCFM